MSRRKQAVVLTEVLKTVPIFSACTDEQLTKLSTCMKEKKFEEGRYLTREGDEGQNFYVIISGSANIIIGRKVIGTLHKGDYCGEVALINNVKRTASIQTKERVVAFCINKTTFQNVLQKEMNLMFYSRTRQAINVRDTEIDSNDAGADNNNSCTVIHKSIHPSLREAKWLLHSVRKNLLFQQLSTTERQTVLTKMHKENIKKGQVLIHEGDKGRTFYIIRSGQFRVTSEKKGHLRYLSNRESVGELALIYNAPRSATVTAMTNATLWAIDRSTLRKYVKELSQHKTSEVVTFLKQISLLKTLFTHEIHRIANAVVYETFKKDSIIMKKGDPATKFYIIKSGVVRVLNTRTESDSTARILTHGHYFGEKALLTDQPRSATLIADETTICYTLTSKQFTLLLGPLTDILNRNMEDYKTARIANNKLNNNGKHQLSNISNNLSDLKKIGRIGVGGYGVVDLIRDPLTEKCYALKSVRKDLIVLHKQTNQIQQELEVMKRLDSPFVVNLHRTYQDHFNVYFLMDVGTGGDLFHYMRDVDHLSTKQVLLYAACIIEALDHIHSFDIVYRDIKPENMIICANGYLKLADYGLAKHLDGSKTYTLCGTPDYLAPETILGRGHDTAVDWWGLGILIYEMIAHMPPFMGSPNQICEKILCSTPKFGPRFNKHAKNIVLELCKKNSNLRLGAIQGGAERIRKHSFFTTQKFDWEKFRNLQIKAPYKPKVRKDDDLSNYRMSLQPDKSKATPVPYPEWAKNF